MEHRLQWWGHVQWMEGQEGGSRAYQAFNWIPGGSLKTG